MGQVKDKEQQEIIRYFLHAVPKLKHHPREFLHEDDEYIIITGREIKYEEATSRWLECFGINAPIYFCDIGGSDQFDSLDDFFDAHAKAKAKFIKALDVDVYFEDAPNIVTRLRKFCPKTIIIQVGRRIK